MLLAGDVGGTKTLLGLFEAGDPRPVPQLTRSYPTAEFASLEEVLDAFLGEAGVAAPITAAAFGVAGPVVDDHAALTNVAWSITAGHIRARLRVPVALLNDLAAIAHAVGLLTPDEVAVLQEGDPGAVGAAAVIAAGTGLGQAFLWRRDGRLVPSPSEGGHADFAARTDREIELVRMLREDLGRVEVEQVVSGRGLLNIHRFTHRGGQCEVVADLTDPDAASFVSRAGMGGRCQGCAEALRMFVSAYGAEAGNAALRGLALSGVYVAGGIAPKILPALRTGVFMDAFLAKAPMRDLLSKIPVKVILNPEAGLLGAAACATSSSPREP
jgi:glucokinase